MTQRKVLLLFMAGAVSFVTAKPDGTATKFRSVDQLFKIAVTETSSQAALVALEEIAAGHPEAVDAQWAASVGITPEDLGLSWMRASDVRAHAM